jgi:hypothetical protein
LCACWTFHRATISRSIRVRPNRLAGMDNRPESARASCMGSPCNHDSFAYRQSCLCGTQEPGADERTLPGQGRARRGARAAGRNGSNIAIETSGCSMRPRRRSTSKRRKTRTRSRTVRECFCNAIDAFPSWNEGQPEPTVEFEVKSHAHERWASCATPPHHFCRSEIDGTDDPNRHTQVPSPEDQRLPGARGARHR